jgi:putative phage-type endonuclease
MWKEFDTYHLSLAEQGSEEWLKLRRGILTASDFGAACGYSKFSTPDVVARDRSGLEPKIFDERAIAVMAHGTKTEPIARQYYMDTYKVNVEEVGLAIWKENPYLGASLDGDVGEGMLEIKCPLRMYYPLSKRMQSGDSSTNNYNHIWPTHYAQMQGCMAICNKKWCDYLVYATETGNVYLERIPFNATYWQDLHAKLVDFINNKLIPCNEEYRKLQAK